MRLNPFALPTRAQALKAELAQAELSLLNAHTLAEQAQAQAEKAQSDLTFHEKRVARLRSMVDELQPEFGETLPGLLGASQ